MKTSRPLGLLAALLACGAIFVGGCSQKKTEESKAPAAETQAPPAQEESSAPPAGTVDTMSAPDTSQAE
jgi:PBP1b-binding outer membrane lipoprotein LpoB